MLNRNCESWYPCVVPDFNRKTVSFSTLSITLTELVTNSFYYIAVGSLYSHFGKSFHHEWLLIYFSSAYYTILIWLCGFSLFPLLILVNTKSIILIDLCMLNHPCDSVMNSARLWCMIFLCITAIDLLTFCWEFYINIHQRYWTVIFLFD